MTLGEEGEGADKPITGNKRLVPEETPEPSAHLAVVISGDGSAAIDGVPVPVVGDESVDIAILDTLHGYARSRSSPVRAAISDPSAGYVAIVEVAPDGSSRLLEQHEEGAGGAGRADGASGPAGSGGHAGSGGSGGPAGSGGYARPAEYAESPEPFETGGRFGIAASPFEVDDEADAIPQPAGPRVTTPALSPATGGKSGRKKAPPQSDDEYEGPSLLQNPWVMGSVAVAVAAIVFGSVMALGSGGAGGGGDKQKQAANAGKNTDRPSTDLRPAPSYSPFPSPSPSVSPSRSVSASPSSSPTASPSPKTTPKPTPKPKAPAPETAATALAKLEAQHPGRHICYRVYLEDDGWQKPVCDGSTAGEANGDQKIKSLNIAVSGTKGMAANAFVHEDGWKTAWRNVADGDDNYIGSTEQDAPHMLGFGISVVEGTVCQDSNVHTRGWLGLLCSKPDNYIFGGTLSNSRWLDAVRFTV